MRRGSIEEPACHADHPESVHQNAVNDRNQQSVDQFCNQPGNYCRMWLAVRGNRHQYLKNQVFSCGDHESSRGLGTNCSHHRR